MIGQFSKSLYITDEKTTKALGPTWAKKWDLRSQFIGYVWSARTILDLPIVGAFVRGIGILKYEITHAQAIVAVPNWLADKWIEQVALDINRAKAAWEQGLFSQNFDNSCSEFGGCPMKRLCMTPNPEEWVSALYVRNTWNPLQKNPEAA